MKIIHTKLLLQEHCDGALDDPERDRELARLATKLDAQIAELAQTTKRTFPPERFLS